MIRFVLMSLAVLGSPVLAQEAEVDCANAMTQMDMNICAGRDYRAADEDLNLAYQNAIAVAKEWDLGLSEDLRGAEDTLREAQRAWLPYRDKVCEATGFLVRGGSMEPMIVARCLETVTRRRTEDIRAVYEMN
ncbi:lysozyme inhibitor LprI family protein [Celeribacter ethanolicus]|nr:lysozyme inhibitor LprI family protein [Celeribacter ethanolicus]